MHVDLKPKQLGVEGDRGVHVGHDVSDNDLFHAWTSLQRAPLKVWLSVHARSPTDVSAIAAMPLERRIMHATTRRGVVKKATHHARPERLHTGTFHETRRAVYPLPAGGSADRATGHLARRGEWHAR